MRFLKWKTHADLAIQRRPVVGRREYLDYMTFQSNERPLFTEVFGPSLGLKEEWEEQGASPAELDFSAFTYRCEARGFLPIFTGRLGGHREVLLKENDDHKLWRDGLGRTMMLPKRYASLPLPMDFPVETMDDWLKIKPWYQFSQERLAGNWQEIAHQFIAEEKVVCVSMPGGFSEPRELMGDEALCIAFYEDPELVHDIISTFTETTCQVLQRVSSAVQIDLLSVHEDMAGNTGPLIGPEMVKQFIAPYYRRVWELLNARGARVFDQDSDGDMRPLIDAFLESGLNCMHPVQPTANMDIVQLREQYGQRLAFYGGIDKHVLSRSRLEILEELEYKIPPMVHSGGAVLGLDHRIPIGVPLENYRFYIEKAWEILNREAAA